MSAQLAKKLSQLTITRCSTFLTANQSKYYCSEAAKNKLAVINLENESTKEKSTDEIMVKAKEEVLHITQTPLEHTKGRLVRIYQKPKNAMQSGTDNTNCWELEFETRQRWENSLMGWCSSGDPLSNMKLQFPSKESAIQFAEKYDYTYYIEYERKEKPKVKSYGYNFSWNKRTRVTTK